jgi:hypothetical protein
MPVPPFVGDTGLIVWLKGGDFYFGTMGIFTPALTLLPENAIEPLSGASDHSTVVRILSIQLSG